MKYSNQYGPVEVDHTKLKYVMYLRKSAEEKNRQVRSINDQENDCRDLVKRLGLRLVGKPLIETRSAKTPGKRPIFRQMVDDLKAGKFDGIVAWHPDRLSRNMLEGGELIDLIDQGILKDLKFALHHFTHDANGKMLLGMSFVLSKQYSDHLSEAVTRGVRGSHSEGKSPAPKHGYLRNSETDFYEPDGENFILMQKAWHKRLSGESLSSIAEWLGGQGYGRKVKKKERGSERRVIKMTKQILTKVFKDPFYYGVLIQANQSVNLLEVPGYTFEPMITKTEYEQAQVVNDTRLKPFKSRNKAFYPLRRLVRCSYCDNAMVVGPSKSSKGERFLYLRCDTYGCMRKKKSIRSKIIFNWVDEFLKDGLNLTEKEYSDYYSNLTSLSDQKRQELNTEHSLQAKVKNLNKSIHNATMGGLKFTEQKMIEVLGSEVRNYNLQLEETNTQVEKIKEKLSATVDDRLTIEQFLNLSKNAGPIVKAGDAYTKDTILRYLFLNLDVNEENVLSYQLKEPFATLLKDRVVLNGQAERT